MARGDGDLIAALDARSTDMEARLRENTQEIKGIAINLQQLETQQNDVMAELKTDMEQGFKEMRELFHNLAKSCGKKIVVDHSVNDE